MPSLQNYKEDYIVFLEAGFIAINQADEDATIKLFKASELLNPSNVMPKIGMAYLHIHKLELKQAQKLLEEVLTVEPQNEVAKTLLGVALSMSPKEMQKGEEILHSMQKKASTEDIKELSTTALDFVDKFLKKSPTPVEGVTHRKK
jgi:Tfp pilus assembly protein PilF